MKGYIKDYRKELESDIWMMPPLYHRVWQYLKYKVNHKDSNVPMRDGSFMTIKKGQHLTSMRKIANGVGYYEQGAWKEPNPKTIKSILNWLEKQNMIQVSNGDGNRKYTLITLLNWDIYQFNNEDGNSKYTVDTQSMDINNNDKECIKNDKEYITAANTREEEFLQIFLNRYMELKKQFHFSPNDEMAAKEIYQSGIDLESALKFLEERFKTYQPKHPRDKINSLEYCIGFILDRYYEEKEGEKGGKGFYGYRGGNAKGAGQSKSYEQTMLELELSKKAVLGR